jgi:hypothetical protein
MLSRIKEITAGKNVLCLTKLAYLCNLMPVAEVAVNIDAILILLTFNVNLR